MLPGLQRVVHCFPPDGAQSGKIQRWLQKKKKRFLGHVSGFVSTSAEIDQRCCQNELLVMTMKIPAFAHCVCVPCFSPAPPKWFFQLLCKWVLFDNHAAFPAFCCFFLHKQAREKLVPRFRFLHIRLQTCYSIWLHAGHWLGEERNAIENVFFGIAW